MLMMKNTHRKRTLAIEICNQQHLRYSGGSLPSSFQTAHLTLPLSGASPIRNRRPCSISPRLDSVHVSGKIENHPVFEPESLTSSLNMGGEPPNPKPLSSEVQKQDTVVFTNSSRVKKIHYHQVIEIYFVSDVSIRPPPHLLKQVHKAPYRSFTLD